MKYIKTYLNKIDALDNDIEYLKVSIQNRKSELDDINNKVMPILDIYLTNEFSKYFKVDYKGEKKFLVDDNYALIYKIENNKYNFDTINKNYTLVSYGIYRNQNGKWLYSRSRYIKKVILHTDTVEVDIKEFINDSVRLIKENSIKRNVDKEKRKMKKDIDKYNL